MKVKASKSKWEEFKTPTPEVIGYVMPWGHSESGKIHDSRVGRESCWNQGGRSNENP